jgi:transcriptional regulator of acetoin/glycerol metabolism
MPVPHTEHVYLVAREGSPSMGVEEVSTSWRRSANEHGVNPDSTDTPRILTSYELKELREPLDRLIAMYRRRSIGSTKWFRGRIHALRDTGACGRTSR